VAHPRKIIRASVKNRLLNITTAQDRVFDTMTPTVNLETMVLEEGPVIFAYTRGTTKVEYSTNGADTWAWHTVEIVIEALTAAKQGQSIDDRLDDLAEQIEALLENHTVTEFPSGDFNLTEAQIDVTDGQQVVVGGIFMTYEFRYLVARRPDTSQGWLPDEDPETDGEPSGGSDGYTLPPGPTSPSTPPRAGDEFIHGTEAL
jgi:hypothetical protein